MWHEMMYGIPDIGWRISGGEREREREREREICQELEDFSVFNIYIESSDCSVKGQSFRLRERERERVRSYRVRLTLLYIRKLNIY